MPDASLAATNKTYKGISQFFFLFYTLQLSDWLFSRPETPYFLAYLCVFKICYQKFSSPAEATGLTLENEL